MVINITIILASIWFISITIKRGEEGRIQCISIYAAAIEMRRLLFRALTPYYSQFSPTHSIALLLWLWGGLNRSRFHANEMQLFFYAGIPMPRRDEGIHKLISSLGCKTDTIIMMMIATTFAI